MKLRQTHITTPEHISLTFHIAGLGSRVVAHIVDWLLLSVLYAIIIVSFIRLEVEFLVHSWESVNSYIIAFIMILLFGLWWGYFILFEFFAAGRTPGKRLAGLCVIQDNGQSVTFLSAVMRNLLRLIDMLPFSYFTGMLFIFFHPKHKRIGDLAAGTMVVYENKKRKKADALDKEIERNKMDLPRLALSDWSRKKIGSREWRLLKTYVERRSSLQGVHKRDLTMEVGEILLPLVDETTRGPLTEDVEKKLLALYLEIRDDWEYEL